MTKAKTKKPAAKHKTVKHSPAKKKAASKKAPPRKKTAARPRAVKTIKKKPIGFTVECKKSKTGAWQKLCGASSKENAFALARAYFKCHPTHQVRVSD